MPINTMLRFTAIIGVFDYEKKKSKHVGTEKYVTCAS